MFRYKKLWIIFLALSFNLWGCSFVSHGKIKSIRQEQVDAIQLNKSTKDEIIKIFGQPQQIIRKPDSTEIYVYQHGLERSVGIPFIVSVGRTGGGGQRLAVSFKGEVVVDYEFTIDQRKIINRH